jgi:hypothetical protein
MKFQTCLKTSLPNLTLQNCLGECSALGGVTSFTEQGLNVTYQKGGTTEFYYN